MALSVCRSVKRTGDEERERECMRERERESTWSLFNKQTSSLICIARSHASVVVRISTRHKLLRSLLSGHLSNVRYLNNDAALERVMRRNRKDFKGHSCRACIASSRRCVAAPRAIPGSSTAVKWQRISDVKACPVVIIQRDQSRQARSPPSHRTVFLPSSSIRATNAILWPRCRDTRDKTTLSRNFLFFPGDFQRSCTSREFLCLFFSGV